MKANDFYLPPQFIPPELLLRITVGELEPFRSIVESVQQFVSGADARNFWIHSEEGGGKSHWLNWLKYKLMISSKDNYSWINFEPEQVVVCDVRDVIRIISKGLKNQHLILSTTVLKNFIVKNNIRIILALEKPHKFFGNRTGTILKEIEDLGTMCLVFSDFPPPSEGIKFTYHRIPPFTLKQSLEMLQKREFPETLIYQVEQFYKLYPFLPITPSLVLYLAKILQLNPDAIGGKLLFCLLQEISPHLAAKLETLSPQQRNLLYALSSFDKLLCAKDLAPVTSSKVMVINAQMKRLRDGGIVYALNLGRKNRVYHLPTNLLLRYWIYQNVNRYESALVKLIPLWRIWKSVDAPLSEKFYHLIRERYCPQKKVLDDLRFLLEPECFPLDLYESLSKIALGYLRGGDNLRAEAMMEYEAERSINLGQQTRAGRARLLTGLIRIINGNMEGAFTALKDAVNLGEKDPLLWINLGTLCYHQGNYTQAGKYFLEGIKVTDKIPHPYVGLGTILRLDGEFDKAEEQFLYALKIDPKYSPALIGLANVQWEKERFEESLSLLQKALILEKDNSTALISVAYIAFTVRDFDNCVGFCRQILQVTKEDKVKSDFALLLFASLCAASIRFAKDRNFGEAENRFHNACTIFSNLNVEEAEEMMAFYFFALANYVESDLWNKMLDFSHSAGLLNLSRILKLHHLAIKAKYSPNKRTEIERLFPEERGIFEEIMAELNQ